MAATVELRRKEIGVRLALGARGSQVLRTVVGEGLAFVSMGFAAGVVLIFLAGRWLAPILFQTSPREPLALTATLGILIVVSTFAAVAPTIRVLRTTLVSVLRVE